MADEARIAQVSPGSGLERAWVVVGLVMASACVVQAIRAVHLGVVLPGARDDLLDGSNTLAGFFGTLNVTAYLLGTLAVSWAASRVSLVGLMRIGLSISTEPVPRRDHRQRPPVAPGRA